MHLAGKSHNDLIDGDQVIAEYDASNVIQAKYVYGAGIDEPILMGRGGETYYYYFDGLGSVTALSDSNGDLTESYTYDVYGALTSPQSTIGNPYYFTGRRYDSETGLLYYRARAYSPRLGRFLETDPLEVDDENKYAYCYNDPINLVDPYGLFVMGLPLPGGGTGGYAPPIDLGEIPKPGENANPGSGNKDEKKVKAGEKEKESPAQKVQEKDKKKGKGKKGKNGNKDPDLQKGKKPPRDDVHWDPKRKRWVDSKGKVYTRHDWGPESPHWDRGSPDGTQEKSWDGQNWVPK